VAQKPRDAVVNFFIEIYSGMRGPPCDSTALVGFVSKGIWRVLDCPVMMLRIGIIGDGK